MNTRKRVILAVVAVVLAAVMLLVNFGVLHIDAAVFGYSVGYWLKDLLMIPLVYSALRALIDGWQRKAYGSFIVGVLGVVVYQFVVNLPGDWMSLLYRLGAVLIGGLVMWVVVRLLDL